MDLVYMNSDREDVGVLLDFELDIAIGTDENSFECTLSTKQHCCQAGYYLYIEGTEYGGIIDAIGSKGSSEEIIYSGRTWHGILNSKVLEPDSGQDYLVCNGDANAVIGTLITRMGLAELFSASSDASGLTISSYNMDRYISGYDGIRKMLDSVNGKLNMQVQNDGTVVLSVVAAVDYSTDEEFDGDLVDFDMKKSSNTVNHLICLGKGELAERTVLHLYVDTNGNISTTQTQSGLAEYAATYDCSNAESMDELLKQGTEQLQSMWEPDQMTINLDATTDCYDIGDKVGAIDYITGLSASAVIRKKIIRINKDSTIISYEVGE